MEELKGKGKLPGFVRARLGEAEERAKAVQSQADEQERAVLADYRAAAESKGEQNIALAVSETRAGEDKRVMTETLEARRSLLKQREDCAKTVLKDVHKRVADYAGTPEYAGTLDELLRRGLAAIPGVTKAKVLLRGADVSHIGHLRAAASGIDLSFAEGFIELGGLIIEFPEQRRRADLTFDTALEDVYERFIEMNGVDMEGSDGK